MKSIVTKNAAETGKLARTFAKGLLSFLSRHTSSNSLKIDELRGAGEERRPSVLKDTWSSTGARNKADRNFKRILSSQALVISLEGNLGAGKTTFIQALAKALGIKEKVASPTYVILKSYKIPSTSLKNSRQSAQRAKTINYKLQTKNCILYHIDCYRLDKPEEILTIGFREILQDPSAVLLIEWGDRVRILLPRKRITLRFAHGGGNTRRIRITGFDGILKNIEYPSTRSGNTSYGKK